MIRRENENGIFLMGKNFPGFSPMGPYLVLKDEIPEVVSLRLEVYGLLPKPEMNSIVRESGQKTEISRSERKVYFEGLGFTPCPIFRRMNLTEETNIEGPAIIEEPASTTVVHPGDLLTVDKMGNLLIDLTGS